jgi:hypothetical protein
MTAIALLAIVAAPGQPSAVEFNRDIRPILSDNCFACHGPDASKRKAKLRLDDRDAAIAKGAIVPGKLAESELIARILLPATDEHAMPPREARKTLSAKQIETLKNWVEQGAKYQPHWAYIVPTKPNVPAGVNPIDHFIAAELAKVKATMSPEADRRTLIRRLSLDLTGLPPSPGEVDEFVKDTSPNACEKVVDRLIASPQYGERMATPWLDLVRFADTVGYHGDQNQRIFPYRDYVIKSFNDNKLFDQFTREQIAGDLLPSPTKEQLVATGFNRLNMMTREGGAQPKEYLAKYQGDRVRTVSMAWLGSTLGCAECHDHKYDPFTARDFYSMSAFFADIRQWGVYSDYNYTPNPDLKGWSNDHPFPPELEVESESIRAKAESANSALMHLGRDVMRAVARGDRLRAGFNDWRNDARATLESNGWFTPPPQVGDGSRTEADRRVVVTAKAGKGHATTVRLRPERAMWVGRVRLELLPVAGSITRDKSPSTTVQFKLTSKSPNGKDSAKVFAFAQADRSDVLRWTSTNPIVGPLAGWKTLAGQKGEIHTAEYWLETPIRWSADDEWTAVVTSDNVSSFRIAVSPFVDEPTTSVRSALQADPDGFQEKDFRDELGRQFILATAADPELFGRARELFREYLEHRNGKAWSQITVSQKPMTTRILPRGNWMDENGPVVTPATPGFLPGLPTKPGQPMDRRQLADWLVMKENPLTARVFVNRLWKQFFGNGLSANLEDVGAQGEPPSHPELLDWLAVEFASDWNVKRAVKGLVMSKAYRQASKAKPELRDVDPNNRLLAYQNPRRLEAEFVRDNVLAISGLLESTIGGPSVKPYQPEGYYANIQFPDRPYKIDTGRKQHRRGLYVHWQRTFLHPMLANFDAPSREECLCNRTVANTPQQALTLLNDPTFTEAARVLADRLVSDKALSSDAAKLESLYRRALARSPKAVEVESLSKLLNAQRKHYEANAGDAEKLLNVGLAAPTKQSKPEVAAWTNVCRVVLNLHETITRY